MSDPIIDYFEMHKNRYQKDEEQVLKDDILRMKILNIAKNS